jgi:hypothetical protein
VVLVYASALRYTPARKGGTDESHDRPHRVPGCRHRSASATSVAQLEELVGGIELQLDTDARATLDRASAWQEG